MINLFRLSKLNFAMQNQMSCGHLVEIAACGKNEKLKNDKVL
jgi:hypothetical protein